MKLNKKLVLIICICLLLLENNTSIQVSMASSVHPRLFFGANDLRALRLKATSTHEEIWQPILATANMQLAHPLVSSEPVDSTLDDIRQQSGSLMILAFTCVITEQQEFCERAKQQLLIYASWRHWDVQEERGLGLAHMVFGNALAYDWLYPALSTSEQQMVRQSLANRAKKLYEASNAELTHNNWQNWWRKAYIQNIYWTAHSALGLAALALLENSPALTCTVSTDKAIKLVDSLEGGKPLGVLKANQSLRVIGYDIDGKDQMWWHLSTGGWISADKVQAAADCTNYLSDPQIWLTHATNKIKAGLIMLNGIADGTWHEGIPYQSYMLTMSLPFMVNLRRLTGRDLFPHTYLRNYGLWRLYSYLPDGTFILPNGDFDWSWAGAYDPPNILRFLAAEYRDSRAEWTVQQIIKAVGRTPIVDNAAWYIFEYLYYNPAINAQPPTNMPLTRNFPDLEAVIWRTGWSDNDLVFGFKSGAYGGRFAFRTFIQGLAPWQPPCIRTECQFNTGHDHDDTNSFMLAQGRKWLAPVNIAYENTVTANYNTILIDGQGQYRPPDEDFGQVPQDFIGRDGTLKELANTSIFSYLAASATNRYDLPDLKDITRYVIFVRPYYFIIVDNLVSDLPHDYEWVSHFGGTVSSEENWIRGDAGNEQTLGVAVISPQPFQVALGHDNYPYVRVKANAPSTMLRFINVLVPMNAANWETRPTITLLQDSGQAIAVRVKMNDGSNRTDDILLTYSARPSAVSVGPYRYDGRAAVIRRVTNGNIEAISMYGGTFAAEQPQN